MRRKASALRTLCVVVAAGAALSCRRSAPPDPNQALSSATVPSAPSAPAAASDAGSAAATAAHASDAGSDLAPSPQPDRRAREHAVLGLLAGGGAQSLPEVATEPNTPLDLALRDRLAPVQKGTGPRGVALIANVEAPDALENAARVIAGMRAAFRACYNRSLLIAPDTQGTVRVRAQVAAAGEVTAAKATPSAPLPPALIACVEGRVRAAQFAATEGTQPADVSFHVRFEVQE